MNHISPISGVISPVAVVNSGEATPKKVEGNLFDSILGAAIDNIKETNVYLSSAENEKVKFALGESESTHDLAIALQKASTALQYTVAVRDKFVEAYREIMNLQI
jgi:flagellar hook-basal body complex protein FliE